MNSPIRVALVGCGWISGAHIDGFRELYGRGCREILFTACCDSNEDNAQRQAAELAGIQGQAPAIFKSIDALLQAKAADVAVACLPHYLHHTLVEQLLASNVQVIRHEPFDYHNPAFKWRGVKMLTGGGLLLDSGAHFADMQLLAFGDPESVYCMLGTHDQQIIPDASMPIRHRSTRILPMHFTHVATTGGGRAPLRRTIGCGFVSEVHSPNAY